MDPTYPPEADVYREKVQAFLAERNDFVQDREIEPLLTFNPGGYLRRIR